MTFIVHGASGAQGAPVLAALRAAGLDATAAHAGSHPGRGRKRGGHLRLVVPDVEPSRSCMSLSIALQTVGVVNSYITAPAGAHRVVAIITGVSIVSRTDSSVGRRLLSEDDQASYELEAAVVGRFEGDKFNSGLTAYPSLHAPVRTATPTEVRSIFLPKEVPSVRLGSSAIAAEQDVYLDANLLLGHHCAIVGSTGSGKSCTVTALIDGLLDNEITSGHIVIFDINGEYAQSFAQGTARGKKTRTLVLGPEPGSKSGLFLPHWFMNNEEHLALLRASEGVQAPVLQRAVADARIAGATSHVEADRLDNVRSTLAIVESYFTSSTDAEGPAFRQLAELTKLLEFQAKQSSPIKAHWEAMAPLVSAAITASGLENKPKWAQLTPKHREVIGKLVRELNTHVTAALSELGLGSGATGADFDAPVYYDLQQLCDYFMPNRIQLEQANDNKISGYVATLQMRLSRLLADGRYDFMTRIEKHHDPLGSYLRALMGTDPTSGIDSSDWPAASNYRIHAQAHDSGPSITGGVEAGLGVLLNPGDPAAALDAPGLNVVAYWVTAGVLILAAASAGCWGWRFFREHGRQVKNDPYRIAGIATRSEVARAASEPALLRRAGHLRPALDKPGPEDVGYRIGTSRGKSVWASVEDSILLIGPPRSGKGAHVVINTILDAPGAVVTTSTRPDNLTATLRARERLGPVAVFDPQHLAEGVSAGMRWSPIRGCEDPLTAMIRATGLAAGTGLSAGGVEGGGFWEGKTRTALQALLHAAALDRRPPGELFRWTLDPSAAADAVAILTANPNAATGWAESLQAMIDSDPRTRDSIWQGVSLALAALADPRVLDAVSPREGEDFDPEAFLRAKGTLYLLATGAGANNSAALVAAFVEDVVEAARRIAARSAGARLDPPLLLALDEVGNLAPLPSLPTLMAEGGGTGITTMPVLQSLAQAREKWSENAAGAIWDASIVKIILGGASNSKDLHDLTTLIGERDEVTDSTTVGDHGSRSAQRSIRRVPIMPPDTIRTLPFGTALVLLRSAPPIVTRMQTWTDRPDAKALRADRAGIEALLQRRPLEEPGAPA